VVGWRATKEAGQIAAGSVPPVESGDAAQEPPRCLRPPGSPLPLGFLLRLGKCCYRPTWPGWCWVRADTRGRELGPGCAGRKDLWSQRFSLGGEALGFRPLAYKLRLAAVLRRAGALGGCSPLWEDVARRAAWGEHGSRGGTRAWRRGTVRPAH
jgi:hypothetical protein